MDKLYQDIIEEAGIEYEIAGDGETAGYNIAIIFDGALDDEFIITDSPSTANEIVNAIADSMFTQFPDNSVDVGATHVWIGADFIEGSGYDSDILERRIQTV